jgi:hypothetical protein
MAHLENANRENYLSNRLTRQRQDLGLKHYVNSFYSFQLTKNPSERE